MKKYFAVPAAVLFIAACSESTAPTSELSPRYAKPTPPPAGFQCSGTCNVDNTFDFSGTITATGTGTATVGTELQTGAAGSADIASGSIRTSNSGESFLGRFTNTRTNVVINIPDGNSTYSVTYDLYIIGSWDGRGKQAQHGVFLANVYDVSYRCNATPGTVTSLFQTSFSNQSTVQQDFPLPYLQGGNKAATGSFDIDALGYRTDPTSNTPQFRSFGDVEYKQSYSGTNPCGTGAFSLIISTSNPTQQSVYDESWGIDNVHVQADS